MTEHEREMFQVMIEKLRAIAQNSRFTVDCRAAARVMADQMWVSLRLHPTT